MKGRLPPFPEDAERWADFGRTIEERILDIRAEAAPSTCAACGSSTPGKIERRRCARCERWLAITLFARNAAKPSGRSHTCKECDAAGRKRRRMRSALHVMRRAS